ncbi:uncharacterized protein LOC111299719 isoform X2 [Durio zibethinus]|uniref:Uncharacterized protein LOC111299719 isoform X2 n=1 Tax=Durio zibethinus TaxID=66656 RepID=A0A6P5ZDC1_DURZI|nr:uncharacterized protein LOC111299719 isoform X2 [Durio zibethinus]
MNVPADSPYKKMSSTRGKGESSGWTAFDLKQQQKLGLVPETENDPFPPMPNNLLALHPCTNLTKSIDPLERSFSSVLKSSGNFPTLKQNKDSIMPINMGKPIENDVDKVVEGKNNDLALKKLKELHCWAENSLIEDVLFATHNNIHEASTLLKGMVPMSCIEDIKEIKTNEMSSTIADFPGNANCDTGFLSAKVAELVSQSCKSDEREENLKMLTDVRENRLFDDPSNMKLILGHLTSIPFEPEWEEDDVYLSHRKDAIRIMRSASQHYRAASNAFLRGDHFAAQQHSHNAREEWLAAQRLNAKAAREILSIRNSDNDLWKLDLHGLHAAEAVQALHEHLKLLEMQVPAGRSVSLNRFKANNGIVCSSSVETVSSMDKLDNQRTSSRRPTSLQVITGVGNHSRGQAALPTAISL